MHVLMQLDEMPFSEAASLTALAITLVYYIALTILLHRGLSRSVGVTRYDPPEGISPAVAAYLVENGRAERAFAAAIVSLAAKGILRIQESDGEVTLEKLKEPEGSVTPEESALLSGLFMNSLTRCSFNNVDSAAICGVYAEFRDVLETVAEQKLFSSHTGLWLGGVAISAEAVLFAVPSVPFHADSRTIFSAAYVILWTLLGGFCFVAALRVWPATIRKLISWLPGVNRPRRPFAAEDATPIFLTATAGFGMAFLASLTSREFSGLVVAVLLVDTVFCHLMKAPTREGRRIIAELHNFREFLSRVDSDRLSLENDPGQTPRMIEAYSPYAIALDVEHAWGEEFADSLLALIQWNRAYGFGTRSRQIKFLATLNDGRPNELHLRDRR
ncbi:MAG TPA: hypothetical protein VL975_00680 [Candidatus Micrarchaeia archaeon]|nr:hypothetical protein [Candidatus Micrarchaeia archaeon]